jgi:PAS domain S-box-containing protein
MRPSFNDTILMRMTRAMHQFPERSELSRYTLKMIVVAGAYFATAKLGLQLAAEHPSITAVWPPTGIALAALLIWGYRFWPGVAIGAALANAFTGDVPAVAVLGIATGNTLEALVGAYLLRLVRFRPQLDRVRDVLALVVLAAGLSTMVSATVGVTSLWIGDEIGSIGEWPSAWRVWWLGDMAGDLLVAPVLLVLSNGVRLRRQPGRIAEACVLLCTLVALSLIIFSRDAPLTYLVFPPLIWAALRFRQLGATVSSLIVAGIAVGFTNADVGPFARSSADDSFLLSQTFTGVGAVAALLLAAITSERQQAEEKLQQAHHRLEGRMEERTAELDRSHKELELQGLIARNMTEGVCLVRASDSAIVYANSELERILGYSPGELDGKHVDMLNYGPGALPTNLARRMSQESGNSGEAPYEVLNRKKDGTPVWCRLHTSAFDHPEYGKVWVAVHEDITERKRADLLERSFIPERLPDIPGVELAARFVPGGAGVDVGGDWYDVIELDSGCIGLVIGDVAGRGVQAAAVMAQLRNALRAYAFESHPPATTLERLNTLAWNLDQGAMVMATAIYLVYDPSSGLVRFANAGHLPPLHSKPDGSTEFLEKGRSLPIGVRSGTSYVEAECLLSPGSKLLLYTDGLVEKRRVPIDSSLSRLADCSSTGRGLSDLCDHVLATLDPSGDDDVALLALEPVTLARENLKLTLPAEPPSLASLRGALRRWLREGETAESERFEIVLACNEAVANSIEHAYGPRAGLVQMDAGLSDGMISITVRDFGHWRSPRGADRGRGLTMIEAIMDSVNISTGPNGTEVRMARKLGMPQDDAA